MTWSPTLRSPGTRCRVLDHRRKEMSESEPRSFRRPKTLPPRRFHDVISPSTQTKPHFSMNPRIVSLSRETDVGAWGLDSRGWTESAGGASPGTASGWNVVMRGHLDRRLSGALPDALLRKECRRAQPRAGTWSRDSSIGGRPGRVRSPPIGSRGEFVPYAFRGPHARPAHPATA